MRTRIPYGVTEIEPTQELKRIREAMIECASPDTALDGLFSRQVSPLHNHCGCVAYTVQQHLGGDILVEMEKEHYLNQLPDGRIIDLSSCQFGGDGYTPMTPDVMPAMDFDANDRILLFANRVSEHLNPEG